VNGVRVPHPVEILHGHGVALACGLDAELRADDLHGLFAGDTRVLSTLRMTLGGQKWQLLSRRRVGHGTARWRFQSPRLSDPGGTLPEGCLFLELERRVAGALHDDLRVTSYAASPVRTTLVLQLDADFADIFEVRQQKHVPPRLAIERIPRRGGLTLAYERGDFRRGLHITVRGPTAPELVGSLLVFDLVLDREDEWRLCVEAEPEIDGTVMPFVGDPHEREATTNADASAVSVRAEPLLALPFERGCADLRALEVAGENAATPYVVAGAPWFYTLFGRDSLLPALMAGIAGSGPARGALSALGALQATERDDWRDAEPGKLPHEVRRGELAHLDEVPHRCYYGAHDVPSLYCLTLWNAWRWTGDRGLLDAHLATAEAALRWCDELGDRDGDGLQEYATRSRRGYRNQGWKDAGDAIVDEDGALAETPLATVELQGYLYAARLAMAELLDACDEAAQAERLRARAHELRALVEDRYWIPNDSIYALALDGRKHALASVASNPGHLLWSGLPGRERAAAVAKRLLEPDLFTGWGLRTLSSEHPRYNPLSYQRGSVWPHDTALAAAGLSRYGLRHEAATLLRAMLEAACAFEDDRLPELFCGFDRSLGAPVPYREANVPQAWASAVPVLAVQLFLGLVPDAPRNRCFVQPWLPDWLPELEVDGMPIGQGTLTIIAARDGEKTVLEEVKGTVEVVTGDTSAALWGTSAPE
jgi:glycogen debranching enzyme